MIFNSIEFIVLFLPTVVILFYLLSTLKLYNYIFLFLFLSSLLFYGSWNINYVWLLLCSIILNFLLGRLICFSRFRKFFFYFGVIINLSILFYYKYTDFFITTVNDIFLTNIDLTYIILPIGISFFTFQQLAYLTDIYIYMRNKDSFISYAMFISFFPQLVAGPIVHHDEMIPQFNNLDVYKVNWKNIYCGLILFSIGLAKKVLIADVFSPMVGYTFDTLNTLTFLEAICSSLFYTLQLYFDFSGYSDMAIACALMFNIHLPWNFNSPYQAKNIQDFWRRWHITLSRWLSRYVYIALGGNRKGIQKTCSNIFITFLLGGIWHGAAWTYVIWGIMHGIALIVHRIWNYYGLVLNKYISWFITFLFVNFAWIIFRATDFDTIHKFCDAFLLKNGFFLRKEFLIGVRDSSIFTSKSLLILFFLFMIFVVLFSKNSSYLVEKAESKKIYIFSIIIFILSFLCICIPNRPSEFIYFQF